MEYEYVFTLIKKGFYKYSMENFNGKINLQTNKILLQALALGGAGVTMASVNTNIAQADDIQTIAETAAQVAPQYGLYPSVMAAQAILESGVGESDLADDYNNYFGVKGDGVSLDTAEHYDGDWGTYNESFRTYDSAYDSFVDNALVIRSNSDYAGAYVENAASYADATASLQGVYATDPNYSAKLNQVIADYGLDSYDYATPDDTNYQDTSGTYTVQAGDTLWTIADTYGTSVDYLMAINGLSSDSLQLGQTISI
jgi:Muramidase (flagellum-specific)